MPVLRDPRRERYCFAVATGTRAQDAARDAGYKHPEVAASKLLRYPEVRGRIAELGASVEAEKVKQIVKVASPTRAWVIAQLCEVVGKAKEVGDRGATLKGLELVGREIGMFVARTMAIESPLERLPADRLLALLALVEEATAYPPVAKRIAPSPELTPELVTVEAVEEGQS